MKDEKFAEYNPNMFGGDNISYASSPQAAEFEPTMRAAQATKAGMSINDDYFQRKLSDGAAEINPTMRAAEATKAGMPINDDYFQRKLSDGAAEINPTMRAAEDTKASMPINDDYFQKKFAEITGSQAAKSDSQSMAASIDSGIRRKI